MIVTWINYVYFQLDNKTANFSYIIRNKHDFCPINATELTKPYTGQTADKNWESPLIQIAHLMSVPYIGTKPFGKSD